MERFSVWQCDECGGRYPSPDGFAVMEFRKYETSYGSFKSVDEVRQLCHPCTEEVKSELSDAAVVQKGSK